VRDKKREGETHEWDVMEGVIERKGGTRMTGKTYFALLAGRTTRR
jgi:hypothetical protein